MPRLAAALAIVLAAGLFGGPVLAGKPLSVYSPVLTNETVVDYPPIGCWDEDNLHEREWQGDLSAGASLIATERMCDPELDGSSAGGEGIFLLLVSRVPLTAYIHQPAPQEQDSLNWPPPPYPYPDVPVLEIGSYKGQTTYAACIVPRYRQSTGSMVGALEGGTYEVVIRNDGDRRARDLRIVLWVRMAHGFWQESRCPEPYRNLEP